MGPGALPLGRNTPLQDLESPESPPPLLLSSSRLGPHYVYRPQPRRLAEDGLLVSSRGGEAGGEKAPLTNGPRICWRLHRLSRRAQPHRQWGLFPKRPVDK